MSEEKKVVELTDEQLEKVSGGKETPKTPTSYMDDGKCGMICCYYTDTRICVNYNEANSNCCQCQYKPGQEGLHIHSSEESNDGK